MRLNELEFQDPSLKIVWEIKEKLEENIAPELKRK